MNILKLLHVVIIFIWVGNLLALTRLLGYLPKEDSSTQERLVRIYRRMYLLIDLPAMILAVSLGTTSFILGTTDWHAGWFHMKITFVIFLIVCDILCGRYIFSFKRKQRSAVTFKVLHVLTAVILIGALSSIYVVRNKEAEIRAKILAENR